MTVGMWRRYAGIAGIGQKRLTAISKVRLIALTIVGLGAIGAVTISAQAANGNNGEKT